MITENFTIKVIDLGFGINLAGRNQDGFNRTKLGAESYMAPEMLAKKSYQGQDIDIFSFGTMILVLSLFCFPFKDASMDDVGYNYLCKQPDIFWASFE